MVPLDDADAVPPPIAAVVGLVTADFYENYIGFRRSQLQREGREGASSAPAEDQCWRSWRQEDLLEGEEPLSEVEAHIFGQLPCRPFRNTDRINFRLTSQYMHLQSRCLRLCGSVGLHLFAGVICADAGWMAGFCEVGGRP